MSPKKALILGTILLVPVLAFLFLKVLGVNRYSLRTYFPASVDSTLVEGQWRYDTTFHQIPSFSLTSQTGKSFSSTSDLKDKVYVVNFFQPSCQGLCKQTLTQLARVQDAFRFKPEVMLVSISMAEHPNADASALEIAQSYGAKPDRWVFLTGDKAQVDTLATKGFWPSVDLTKEGNPQPETDRLWLVDKQGHIRGVYDGSKALETDKLITEINVLLSGYDVPNGK